MDWLPRQRVLKPRYSKRQIRHWCDSCSRKQVKFYRNDKEYRCGSCQVVYKVKEMIKC